MGLRCSACGFRSTERALFRRERAPVPPLRYTLCLACKKPEPWPKATVGAAVWGGIALALIAAALAGADLELQGYVWLVLMAFAATCPLAVVVHEIGHALAAVLVGRKIYVLSFGRGATLASWSFGDLQIVLARDLGAGFIQAYPGQPESRWRTSLYLAGGMIANAVAVGAVILLLAHNSPDALGPGAKSLASAAMGFALSNSLSAASAIVPRQMKWEDQRLASDGRRLVNLWRTAPVIPDYSLLHAAFCGDRLIRAGRWREAQEHYAAVIARAPDCPGFLGCLVHVVARARGPAAAMACYVEHRAAFEAGARKPSPQYGYAAGNVAWQALRTGDASWLELAGDLSEQAVSMDSASASLRATRGAALIAKGERGAGAALLSAALRDVENLVDKAEFCSFLAKETSAHGEGSIGVAFGRLESHLLRRAQRQAVR